MSRSLPTTTPRRAVLAVAGVATIALLLAACGSSNGKTAAKTTTRPPIADATTSAPSGGVDPNAPEVNPAGDIPDNQVFVDYAPPSGGYHVKVPEGWARSEQAGAVIFTDKFNSVRIETATSASAPTVQSATQNEVPAIEAAAKNYEAGKVVAVTRKAGPAVLITYRADSDPNPVTGKVIHLDVERYEFWRNGIEVILTLSGPVGADNVDPWRIITDSFGWQ